MLSQIADTEGFPEEVRTYLGIMYVVKDIIF